MQSSQGVTFTTYQLTVDSLAAVRTTKAEEDVLWDPIQGVQKTEVLSVITFRGQNRSDPRYIRSNSAAQTGGTGIVQQTSLIIGFGAWARRGAAVEAAVSCTERRAIVFWGWVGGRGGKGGDGPGRLQDCSGQRASQASACPDPTVPRT